MPNNWRTDLARFVPGLPAAARDWIAGSGGADVGLPMGPGQTRDPRLPAPDALDAVLEYVQRRKALEGSTLDQVQQGAGAVQRLAQPQQPAAPAPSVQELQRRIDRMGIQ